jgi:tryptophan synthase alpha chain
MRIGRHLGRLAGEGRKGLVAYLCVGDPDLETSRQCVLAAAESGADVIELGVPFSDPIADGPVIQAASQRALAAGSSLPRALELAAFVRSRTEIPLLLFGYYNPFFRYGDLALARDAVAAGVDGMLCVDLPPEEAADLVAACKTHGLDRVFLVAPTSGESRIRAVAGVASGFVYVVSVTGVTGARSAAPSGIEPLVRRVAEISRLPVGVGFGISTTEQAVEVGRYADLVVVGSALVRALENAGPRAAPATCARVVGEFRRALDGAFGGAAG